MKIPQWLPEDRPAIDAAIDNLDPSALYLALLGRKVCNHRTGDTPSPVSRLMSKTDPSSVMLARLLEHGYDAYSLDKTGMSPLERACQLGRSDLVGLLLEHGADPNMIGLGRLPVLVRSIANAHTLPTRLLVEAGADPNLACRGGITPLMCAAKVGAARTLELLLERNADVTATDEEGKTALVYAARQGNALVTQMLLAKDRAPAREQLGTALVLACRKKSLDTVRLLLRYGAPVDFSMQSPRYKRHWTPLQQALYTRRWNIAKLLLARAASPVFQRAGQVHYAVLYAEGDEEAELVRRGSISKADALVATVLLRQHVTEWEWDHLPYRHPRDREWTYASRFRDALWAYRNAEAVRGLPPEMVLQVLAVAYRMPERWVLETARRIEVCPIRNPPL